MHDPKFLLMVLSVDNKALAANIFSQPGKIGCIWSKRLKYLKIRFFPIYRKIPRIRLPVFKPRHINLADFHFIMMPKQWVHVFRLNAESFFFLCLFEKYAPRVYASSRGNWFKIVTSIYVHNSIHLF